MKYTLYDKLLSTKYYLVEALKNDYPINKTFYNDWVEHDILSRMIYNNDSEGDISLLYGPGVYLLGDYYVGKTSRPIILRIIDHLLETIPTVNGEIPSNIDKVTITKLNLVMSKTIVVNKLSDNPNDEEAFIKSFKNLTNKKNNENPINAEEWVKNLFTEIGFYSLNKYDLSNKYEEFVKPIFYVSEKLFSVADYSIQKSFYSKEQETDNGKS